jgi:hypothetical protein
MCRNTYSSFCSAKPRAGFGKKRAIKNTQFDEELWFLYSRNAANINSRNAA